MSAKGPYSVIVPNSNYCAPMKKEDDDADDDVNRGPIRRSPKSEILFTKSLRGCLTLFETFRNAAKKYPNRPCLGARVVDSQGNVGRFLFKSYNWCSRTSDELAAGMVKEGLIPASAETLKANTPNLFRESGIGEHGARVLGIYMKNCPEWILFEYACYSIRTATVPLYHTLDLPSLKYIIEHTQLTTVVCSLEHEELSNLCQLKEEGGVPSLKAVILNFESLALVPPPVLSRASKAQLKLMTIWELARIGRAYPARLVCPSGGDIATFCYTSGTTGVPKGALITHENIMSVANAALLSVFPDMGPTDTYLSFLPLPHIFERMVLSVLLSSGAAIGFSRGDPQKVVEDTAAMQPTIYCAVPRLLNKIHDKILLATVPPLGDSNNPGSNNAGGKNTPKESWGAWMKRSMLSEALRVKTAQFRATGQTQHGLWDALLFKKLKNALGLGNVRHMLSGGAPLSVATAEFFQILLGPFASVHEGYGLTETTGGLSITEAGDTSTPGGHVGTVLPCVEVCLGDIPSMEYLSTDSLHSHSDATTGTAVTRRCNGRGEILVRGPGVFLGYYRDPINTEAAFTKDGWFKTGDVGLFLPRGQLAIIDRKKNVLKLSQGEYVALEKVENVLGKCLEVGQIFVYGRSSEDSLVGVVIPDQEASSSSASLAGASSKQDRDRHLLSLIQQTGRANGLHGFEIVQAIYVEEAVKEWTPSMGLMTPTLKIKRSSFESRYKGQIEEMYRGLRAGKGKSSSGGVRARL